jgi:DNA-directed RNA polymerase subunit beta
VELVELATNIRKGVPMGSPVFDGAVEADVTARRGWMNRVR